MSEDFEVSKELIKQLVDGTIDDDNAERLLKLPRKDKKGFSTILKYYKKKYLGTIGFCCV